jgi:hypothetical protein
MCRIFFCLMICLFSMPCYLAANEPNTENSISLEMITAISSTIDPDKIELTVKGKINKRNPVHFDLKTFLQLKTSSFITKDHWTGEPTEFTGISFIGLLELLGLESTASYVDVIASNDYKVSIKISDLKNYDYLLAYKLNNKLYSEHDPKDDKGPIAIAINFDKHPELDWEIYKHQLVWFVETIIVQ